MQIIRVVSHSGRTVVVVVVVDDVVDDDDVVVVVVDDVEPPIYGIQTLHARDRAVTGQQVIPEFPRRNALIMLYSTLLPSLLYSTLPYPTHSTLLSAPPLYYFYTLNEA